MGKFRKLLLIAYIVIIIGHIFLYFLKEESLTSFVLGVLAMVFMIIALLVSKKERI